MFANRRVAEAKHAEAACVLRLRGMVQTPWPWRDARQTFLAYECAQKRRVLVEAEELARDAAAIVVEGWPVKTNENAPARDVRDEAS